MLLSDLHELTEFGAGRPIKYWWLKYQPKNLELADELAEVVEGIEAGAGVRENIEFLAKILKQDRPNEYQLSRLILQTAVFFKEQIDTMPEENKREILTFISDSKKFCDRAQTAEFLGRERDRIKTVMLPKEQITYDFRLFQLDGMMYCLEYYLTIYKIIIDSPDEAGKRKVIESNEFDSGAGDVPGLWTDFNNDEVLKKFILKILNDDLRQELETAYYTAKDKIAKIKMICDKQGICSVIYDGVSLDEIVAVFKKLIKIKIRAFPRSFAALPLLCKMLG